MKHTNLISGLMLSLALGSGASADHPQSRMLEEAIESNANLISLPSSLAGVLAVRTCSACSSRDLRLGPQTRFYIGARAVTLQEMNTRLRAAGNAGTMIFYNVGDGHVSRVTVGP